MAYLVSAHRQIAFLMDFARLFATAWLIQKIGAQDYRYYGYQ